MSETQELDNLLGAMLQGVSASARQKLSKAVAIALRRSQQRRIASQKNPDGSEYEARKPIRNEGAGRIRKSAMFRKIRSSHYLRTSSTASEASVEFAARVTRLATVHQFGLRDRVSKRGPEVRYARRELLGFSDDDLDTIRGAMIDHLAAQL